MQPSDESVKPTEDWHVFDAERSLSVWTEGDVYHVRDDLTKESWDLNKEEWQQLLSDGPNPQDIT